MKASDEAEGCKGDLKFELWVLFRVMKVVL